MKIEDTAHAKIWKSDNHIKFIADEIYPWIIDMTKELDDITLYAPFDDIYMELEMFVNDRKTWAKTNCTYPTYFMRSWAAFADKDDALAFKLRWA